MSQEELRLRQLQSDVAKLASVMDDRFRLPGTSLRFGLDGIIGLIPGVGDVFTAAISTFLIGLARQAGASPWLMARMAGNVGIDTALGAIPVIGDAFDFAFKANRANTALLERHIEKRLEQMGAGEGQVAWSRRGGPIIDAEAIEPNGSDTSRSS